MTLINLNSYFGPLSCLLHQADLPYGGYDVDSVNDLVRRLGFHNEDTFPNDGSLSLLTSCHFGLMEKRSR